MAEATPVPAPLADRDRAVLAFERQWWRYAGAKEEAIRRVEPAHDERYKWFAPFGFVRYADEQGRPWARPGRRRGLPCSARAWSRRPGWSAPRPTASR